MGSSEGSAVIEVEVVNFPVVLRDEAQAELDDAFDYYEDLRIGMGVDLVARVQRVFDRIAANPKMHQIVLADVRREVVTRFPYNVLYRADSSRIEVIAVFHTSRDPSIWQRRV